MDDERNCADDLDDDSHITAASLTRLIIVGHIFFFLCMFLGNQRFIFVIFSSVAPHRGQPAAKGHPWVATHQEIGSQLWAGETPDSNPGLQDNSLVRYH